MDNPGGDELDMEVERARRRRMSRRERRGGDESPARARSRRNESPLQRVRRNDGERRAEQQQRRLLRQARNRWSDDDDYNGNEPEDGLSLGSFVRRRRSRMIQDLDAATGATSTPAKPKPPPAFVPENPSACAVIRDLFMEEESADAVFEVGGQEETEEGRKKKAKTATTFYAHRIILKKCAAVLAEMCGTGGGEPIQIADVTPEIFNCLLSYVYGGTISASDMKKNAREIIDAADRYGVTGLKLTAEASYVKSTKISVEIVSELLLYADSKNCALLKEAVLDFVVENKTEVLEKVSLTDIPGGMTDVLAAMARAEKKRGSTDLSTMFISELRRKAHKKGLEVDGSREMLISALKAASNDEADNPVSVDETDNLISV